MTKRSLLNCRCWPISSVVPRSDQYVGQSVLGYACWAKGMIAQVKMKDSPMRVFVVITDSSSDAASALDKYASGNRRRRHKNKICRRWRGESRDAKRSHATRRGRQPGGEIPYWCGQSEGSGKTGASSGATTSTTSTVGCKVGKCSTSLRRPRLGFGQKQLPDFIVGQVSNLP